VNNKALKFAPVETGEKRIELSLEGDETVIKLASWVDGLGWCGEKTIRVEADMLDEMHRLIGAARIRVRSRQAENDPAAPVTQKVLNFPVIS
jgi:hypothetical protein